MRGRLRNLGPPVTSGTLHGRVWSQATETSPSQESESLLEPRCPNRSSDSTSALLEISPDLSIQIYVSYICIYAYIKTNIHVYIHIYVLNTRIYVYHIYTYAYICTQVFTHIYTYIYITARTPPTAPNLEASPAPTSARGSWLKQVCNTRSARPHTAIRHCKSSNLGCSWNPNSGPNMDFLGLKGPLVDPCKCSNFKVL